MDIGLGVSDQFVPQKIRMDPSQNGLPTVEDPHRARHDRLAVAPPAARAERVAVDTI